jgi:hypothetical protein
METPVSAVGRQRWPAAQSALVSQSCSALPPHARRHVTEAMPTPARSAQQVSPAGQSAALVQASASPLHAFGAVHVSRGPPPAAPGPCTQQVCEPVVHDVLPHVMRGGAAASFPGRDASAAPASAAPPDEPALVEEALPEEPPIDPGPTDVDPPARLDADPLLAPEEPGVPALGPDVPPPST